MGWTAKLEVVTRGSRVGTGAVGAGMEAAVLGPTET